LTDATPRPRRAARILLLDRLGRALLLRFVIPRSDGPFLFWATPGGGQEPGETDLETADRELREELGLVVPVEGPVHEVTAVFEFGGEMMEQTDVFFVGRAGGEKFGLGGIDETERAALREMRWWTADEIARAAQPVFPADLAALVRKFT